MHPFQQFINPHLGRLLNRLKLDKRFVRGEGCYLFDAAGERYLDFVAAYGALPFGFNPPAIWAALQAVEKNREPSFVQPSALEAAGLLADRLIQLAPRDLRYVTFTNSGAEAVEAAIKLCRAATGRLGILTAENSFHGKTLGALSATGRSSYQTPFGAPVPGFERLPYGDLSALENTLAHRPETFAALILEPIQGEGGIIIPPSGYLAAARELCHRYGVLFVLDEIQTGLGRTGRLFACEREGITPDVMLLAKALGGGLMPIGAVLCTAACYTEEFATKHSSTFAGNTLACQAGIATLDLLTRDNQALIRQVAVNGARLKTGLTTLKEKYPHVLKAVRGEGYLLGLEFGINGETFGRSCLLGVLADQENLTPLIASYLLNVHKIRVAPTLNGAQVIRIEPPLTATREMCREVITAIDHILAVLATGNTAELLGHLLDIPTRPQVPATPIRAQKTATPAHPDRFAFIVHPIASRNYAEMDQSLQVFSPVEINRLAERFNDLIRPFVIGKTQITANGRSATGEFIAVVRTPEQLLALPVRDAVSTIREAVDLARQRGARIVGLGAYTSVITRGGLLLKNPGVPLTTGNSYTVATAVAAITKAARDLNLELNRTTAAVVGATGAVGRATALLLAETAGRLILIGNPAHPEHSRRRLAQVAMAICRHLTGLSHAGPFPEGSLGQAVREANNRQVAAIPAYLADQGQLVITTDLEAALPACDLIVTATSSPANLIIPQYLKFGAVVCDLSKPPNVSPAVSAARPDVLVIDGGIVAVPGKPDFGWYFGFPPGQAYACMAETMILALEQRYTPTSLGTDLNLPTIRYLREAGEKLGFRLAQLRSFEQPLPNTDWERLLAIRSQLYCHQR